MLTEAPKEKPPEQQIQNYSALALGRPVRSRSAVLDRLKPEAFKDSDEASPSTALKGGWLPASTSSPNTR